MLVTPWSVLSEPGPPGPAGIVFVYAPYDPNVLVTLTETIQSKAGVTVAPESEIVAPPGVAAAVPGPQFVKVNPLGEATTNPVGNVSV